MKRTYKSTENPDGSVTVESTGPISRAWRVIRVLIALPFLVAVIAFLVHGQIGEAVVSLIIGALILPRRR